MKRAPMFDDEGLLPAWFVVAVPVVILLICWGIGLVVLACMERA